MSTVPPPPAPRRDHDLLWLLAGVVLLAGFLVAAGLYTLSRYAARVVSFNEELRGRAVRIQTPGGSLQASRLVSPQETGLPVYPGARLATGREGAALSFDIPLEQSVRFVAARLITPDAFDQVVGYYRRELGRAAAESRGANSVRFSIASAGKRKWVVVSREDSGTEIALINVTEAGGQ
jgi:hypothetical protein